MVERDAQRALADYITLRLKDFSTSLVNYTVDWSATLQSDRLDFDVSHASARVVLSAPFVCQSIATPLSEQLSQWLQAGLVNAGQTFPALHEKTPFQVSIEQFVAPATALTNTTKIESVQHIVAVASGKGGVGKSTTAVNLALALHQEGARVGLLDADIYGPSLQMMLGIDQNTRPELIDAQRWRPINAHGVAVMSMAFMVTDRTPMLWRGPMVSGALLQLLNNTLWPELDYLIVDMPPGTGDIQITMVQKVPITGAVIVTTPQDIALLDAKKGIEMFQQVGVPILGVVENMSMHRCSKCGFEEPIFGEAGGSRIASLYQTHVLGRLPLHVSIREQADAGAPIVVANREGELASEYRAIARASSASLWSQLSHFRLPEIEIRED